MQKSIGDLHCHPSLKPSNNTKIKDIWTYKENLYTKALFKGFLKLGLSPRKWLVNSFAKDLAKHTQCNLDNCYEGNNRLLFLAIYPPERPFLKPNRPFKNSTNFQRLILDKVFGIKLDKKVDNKIIRVLTGFSRERVNEYLQNIYNSVYVNYFKDDYLKEYRFITQSNLSVSTNDKYVYDPSFKLVQNFEEFKKIKSGHVIAGIITVEGMHALGNYRNEDLFTKETINDLEDTHRINLENSFKDNINTLKDSDKTEFPPFFITFSHHFNNLISGHAKSFADAKNKTIPGFSNVFNQQNGLNLGITDFGKELIEDYLLSRSNGPRILIDTKHMSLKSRDDYFKIVRKHWTAGDKVPIVCSHTAINGIPTRAEAGLRNDTNKLDENSYVSRWDINVTDEDIREIFDTEGILGICMHDGRMPGGKFKKMLKDFKKGMYNSRESVNRLHGQMFLTNIFHVVKVNLAHIRAKNTSGATIDEKTAWNTVCLGSDNDGIVDPFDHYNKADSLDEFQHRLPKAIKLNFKSYWKKFRILSVSNNTCEFYTKEELSDLLCGYSPEEAIEKVFSENLVNFMSTYFTKAYLNQD